MPLFNPISQQTAFRGASFDGNGGVISVGSYQIVRVVRAGTITGWTIEATGVSPTATFDVWKIASGTALPTVANTIMGTKPALTTGNAVKSTTLTGWTTSIAAGDILIINVDAVTAATKINFGLEITFN